MESIFINTEHPLGDHRVREREKKDGGMGKRKSGINKVNLCINVKLQTVIDFV